MKRSYSVFQKLFFLFALQIGVMSMSNISYARVNPQAIVRNPQSMSGQYIKDGLLEGLTIKNASITGLKLKNVKFRKVSFENISFENCTFEKVNFSRINFKNVQFKNCVFKEYGSKNNPDDLTQLTGNARDVLFQSCELRNIDFTFADESSGFLLFKNITTAYSVEKDGPFISSGGMHTRIDNCSFQSGIIGGDENASLMVKNSTFTYASIYAGKTFISGSKFSNASNPGGTLLVITDSELTGGMLQISGIGYALNNTYKYNVIKRAGREIVNGVGIETETLDNKVYVTGKEGLHCLRIFGGDVEVRGLTLFTPMLTQANGPNPIQALNLKDVTMQGAYWKWVTVLGGKWENVRIEPPVVVEETSFQNIQAYRLEYPKGMPFTNKNKISLDVKEVHQPFDWPAIVAPTPEEHGLIWWPEVEPGYKP